MHPVKLVCENVPAAAGLEAASDITREFAEHRPHYQNVICEFSDSRLTLSAESDFDPDGANLMDEFSDCISIFIATPFDGEMRVVSVRGTDLSQP
jgi:hypothetical protein